MMLYNRWGQHLSWYNKNQIHVGQSDWVCIVNCSESEVADKQMVVVQFILPMLQSQQ
jgi:hypothetical protein